MRTVITIIALTTYLIAANFLIWRLGYGCKDAVSVIHNKEWLIESWVFISTFALIDEWCKYTTFLHKQFNHLCKLALILDFIIYLLIYLQVLKSPVEQFIYFNGSMLAVTVMILISGLRHGTFTD